MVYINSYVFLIEYLGGFIVILYVFVYNKFGLSYNFFGFYLIVRKFLGNIY